MSKKMNGTKFVVVLLVSGLLYAALMLPLRAAFAVLPQTVTLAAVLYPFLGISYGWPAAIGLAVSKALVDGFTANWLVAVEGLVPSLFATMVPFWIWKSLTAGEDHIHRLDSVKRMLKFTFAVLASAFICAIGVGVTEAIAGNGFWNAAFFTLLNNFDVAIVLGCPAMIVSNQIISRRAGSDRVVTPNEKIIIGAAIAEAIGLAVMFAFLAKDGVSINDSELWNNIYLFAVVLINSIMIVAFDVMVVDQEIKKNTEAQEKPEEK